MKSFILKNKSFSSPGRAVNLDDGSYDQVVIDSCTFTHTGGIFIQAKQNMSILIQNCTFNEIIKTKEMEYAQAIQVSGLDEKGTFNPIAISLQILDNTITNTSGISDVEDCINLIMVSNSKLSDPLLVSGNTIVGAYPKDTSPNSLRNYSGGGIIADRGCTGAMFARNHISETCNYGIGIAGGSNNVVRVNTVTAKHAQNVGIYCYNAYPQDPFEHNYVAPSNIVSWMTPRGRNDFWIK